ncbi:MAG: hypothetical protein MR937_10080 [Spirochaetia bacterium]|jgi:hypothetical protein|nr:hypothetical protein [Spirochaetia bacterium]MDY4526293.1 hypothetical protein [Treponema sp.]
MKEVVFMQEVVKNAQYYVMKGTTWYNKNKLRVVADKRDKEFLETEQYVCIAIMSSPHPAMYLEETIRNAM